MTLTRLQIRNFQCHEDLTIELSPGITVLSGDTEAGKSAVLRSLKWLVSNSPQGIGFIRGGAEKVTVSLTFLNSSLSNSTLSNSSNSKATAPPKAITTPLSSSASSAASPPPTTVIRVRSSKINQYRLNKKRYKAFGTKVPEEVVQVLNLSELNFQGQHDPPFWFFLTAGQVSKELNAIVNLDLVDGTLSNVLKQVRNKRAEVELTRQRLRQAEADREELADVPQLVAEYRRLQSLQQDLAESQQKHVVLTRSLDNARKYAAERDRLAQAISATGNDRARLDSIASELIAKRKRRRKLKHLLAVAQTQEAQICAARNGLARVKKRLEQLSQGRCLLCGAKLPQSLPSS